MEQSSGHASEQAQQPRPHRDMMFCHECHDEWYRDEHGLACPECGSDFTEIIEDNHDPRNDHMQGLSEEDDDMPDLHDLPPHLQAALHSHPWRQSGDNDHNNDNDDPAHGDIRNIQFRQAGPGGFAVTGTFIRSVSPSGRVTNSSGGGGNDGTSVIVPFANMLSTILGGGRPQNQGNQEGQGNQAEGQGTGTPAASGRFIYTPGARLAPRDPDSPRPRVEPVDELNNVIVGLMAALGSPPHTHPHDQPRYYHTQGPPFPAPPPHALAMGPLMAMVQQMTGGHGAVGDAVYSQEALDQIITQLMEQTTTSNAPPPASQSDIDNLPRKLVTVDMLHEGHAECSICMEEVNIGEEVAELPCHHWFHHTCVAAWLTEHDTCPHCRQGITKRPENSGNQDQNQPGSGGNNASTSGSSSRPSGQTMPGAFGSDDSNHSGNAGGSDSHNRSRSAEESHSGGGIGERLRRGLFGL